MKGNAYFVKSLKIACAAAVSIALAGELGLQNSVTAGIITILSIQNTKRETFRRAWNRGLAFACALVLSFGCFSVMGYTLWAFAVYLLLFAMLCYSMKWAEAISTVSVLVTHILKEQSFAPEVLLNEALVFLIGVSVAILVNLHLRGSEEEFASLAGEVDRQMREIIHQMSTWLYSKDCMKNDGMERDGVENGGMERSSVENDGMERGGVENDGMERGSVENDGMERDGMKKSCMDCMEYETDCFERLAEALEKAGRCAVANYDNTLFRGSSHELDYIRMREQQGVVLKEIYENIKRIEYLPKQAMQIAELLEEIEQDYRESSTVRGLLGRLDDLFADMQGQELPASRDEFEARAILFYILMQLEVLLQAKQDFLESENSI